jgi:hypothetical protein
MQKLKVVFLLATAVVSSSAMADGSEEKLLERNRVVTAMQFNEQKLKLQASMAKSYKDMNDAGFIVDENGTPMGIGGDMERLALEVRRRGGMQSSKGGDASDPFGGMNPVIPMPPQNGMFSGDGFQPLPDSVGQPAAPEPKKAAAETKVEVVKKPTEDEKAQGKQVLRLAEVKGQSVVLFTNDGFKQVKVGQKVYDQKVAAIGVDSVTMSGPDGTRILRIDWTKSVRYTDD